MKTSQAVGLSLAIALFFAAASVMFVAWLFDVSDERTIAGPTTLQTGWQEWNFDDPLSIERSSHSIRLGMDVDSMATKFNTSEVARTGVEGTVTIQMELHAVDGTVYPLAVSMMIGRGVHFSRKQANLESLTYEGFPDDAEFSQLRIYASETLNVDGISWIGRDSK